MWLKKLKSKTAEEVAQAFRSVIKSSGRQPLFLLTGMKPTWVMLIINLVHCN